MREPGAARRIAPLSSDAIAQIRSSVAVSSLNCVVCELVKNSLNAAATTISITIDFSTGSCVVEDDGVGILPGDFTEDGGLLKQHRTYTLPMID